MPQDDPADQDPAGPGFDPADWPAFRAWAHRAMDVGLDHIEARRDRPAWAPMPADVRARWAAPLPEGPAALDLILDDLARDLLPWNMGNTHPRFFGWYMGGGTATGAVADFLAAIEGSNLGGGNTAALAMDQQVTRWLTGAMGFPPHASATLVAGGSMANLICLLVARNATAGVDVRAEGITGLAAPPLFYASAETHSATQKALEALGLGRRALRLVPATADFRMDLAALAAMIAEDRAAGHRPACVIGTAGTTSTGAVDDLAALAGLARAEGLWFHVDGAIGAALRLSGRHSGLVDGIERADSLAMDLHKWMQVPFDCGCAILRDGAGHFAAFNAHPAYLEEHARGVAAAPFLGDFGLDLTRNLRALKVWMAVREHGRAGFGRLIDHQIGLAQRLARGIAASSDLELAAPQVLNIVCFRHLGRPGMTEAERRAFNIELMLRIQESGLAVPTDTTLAGRHALRAAIVNHRVQAGDIDLFLSALHRTGAALLAGG